jgi:hypothetical protein
LPDRAYGCGVPSPLDPLSAFSKLFTSPPTTPGELVERWVDATSWWVEPMARSSAAVRERMAPERMLAELIDGMIGRFGGHRLELAIQGQRVKGLLESLRVVGASKALGVIADLSDVEWDGPRLSTLHARATGVRLEYGVPASLAAERVELTGSCDVDGVVGWAADRTDGWTLSADADGRLLADRPQRGVNLIAEPSFADGRLELELRQVRWRDRTVTVPRWLRLARPQPLPDLPDGIELLDAHRTGRDVWFRVGLGPRRSALDLGRVRDAVLKGSTVPVG